MVFVTELSADWIISRVARIITFDNDYPFIIQITYTTLIFKIAAKLRFILPHKIRYAKINENYNQLNKLEFLRDSYEENKDSLDQKILLKGYLERTNKKVICCKLDKIELIEYIIFIVAVIVAVGVIWWGYFYTNYEFISDVICFTIWEIWFIFLHWSYYRDHVADEFFRYFDLMKLLVQFINDDYDENVETVLLCKDKNICIWMNLWSTIRRESWNYFDNQKYFIISTFCLLLFSAIFGIIRLLIFDFSVYNLSAENEDIIFYGAPSILFLTLCGLILLKLMFLSFVFPTIQKQQIRSIMDQQWFIDCIIAKKCLSVLNHTSSKQIDIEIRYLESVQKLLGKLVEHIRFKGISPKIGGIQMNRLFLGMLWTMFIFSITTLFRLKIL